MPFPTQIAVERRCSTQAFLVLNSSNNWPSTAIDHQARLLKIQQKRNEAFNRRSLTEQTCLTTD